MSHSFVYSSGVNDVTCNLDIILCFQNVRWKYVQVKNMWKYRVWNSDYKYTDDNFKPFVGILISCNSFWQRIITKVK